MVQLMTWFHNMFTKTMGQASVFNTSGLHKFFDESQHRNVAKLMSVCAWVNVHHYQRSSLVYHPLEDIMLPQELEIISNCPFMGKFLVCERVLQIFNECCLGNCTLKKIDSLKLLNYYLSLLCVFSHHCELYIQERICESSPVMMVPDSVCKDSEVSCSRSCM